MFSNKSDDQTSPDHSTLTRFRDRLGRRRLPPAVQPHRGDGEGKGTDHRTIDHRRLHRCDCQCRRWATEAIQAGWRRPQLCRSEQPRSRCPLRAKVKVQGALWLLWTKSITKNNLEKHGLFQRSQYMHGFAFRQIWRILLTVKSFVLSASGIVLIFTSQVQERILIS